MATVLVTMRGLDSTENGPLGALHRAGHEAGQVPRDRRTLLVEAVAALEGCAAVVAGGEPQKAELFDAAPWLQHVTRFGAGFDVAAETARGILVTVVLTPRRCHEAPVFPRLLAAGAIRRPVRGRPRVQPGRIVGDKGCGSHGIRHTIPRKRTEHRGGPFDRRLHRLRHKIENAIVRCKQFHALATRDEKRGEQYRALWVIAMAILWLR